MSRIIVRSETFQTTLVPPASDPATKLASCALGFKPMQVQRMQRHIETQYLFSGTTVATSAQTCVEDRDLK